MGGGTWEATVHGVAKSRHIFNIHNLMSFPDGTVVKNLPANARDSGEAGLIPGSGRSLGEGNVNQLQYFCLENSMDRGAWQATVHGVTEC